MQPPRQPTSTTHETANPGYALGQLARALTAGESDPSADGRQRALRKARNWIAVLQGMLSGSLQIGSSTPVAGTPKWVTLEVVQGGFATGALLAAGPLQPHEEEMIHRLPAVQAGAERAALNAYYLTEEGLDELRRILSTGRYRVNVPEEAALLVVA
jgi:hypothetical protein